MNAILIKYFGHLFCKTSKTKQNKLLFYYSYLAKGKYTSV